MIKHYRLDFIFGWELWEYDGAVQINTHWLANVDSGD